MNCHYAVVQCIGVMSELDRGSKIRGNSIMGILGVEVRPRVWSARIFVFVCVAKEFFKFEESSVGE